MAFREDGGLARDRRRHGRARPRQGRAFSGDGARGREAGRHPGRETRGGRHEIRALVSRAASSPSWSTCSAPRRAPHARGDEGARRLRLLGPRECGRTRMPTTVGEVGGATGRRRREPARGRLRRQRRPGLERQPDTGRRGRAPRAADDRALRGVAGLLAGAFSMAAGEYISVRSQREMFEYQIGLERDELEEYPDEEAEELALIYAARGMPTRGGARDRTRARSPNPEQRSTRWRARSSASTRTTSARPGARRCSRSPRSRSAPSLPLLPFLFGLPRAAC